jgi:Polyketide cyclase / dehydrase and lipid transport
MQPDDFSDLKISIRPPKRSMEFPYRWWIAPLLGGLYGLLVRVLFMLEHPFGYKWGPMLSSFLFLTPFVTGAITVYIAERQKPRSVGYHAGSATLAVLLTVAGTAITLIEGVICIIMALPIFVALGVLGGLIMGQVCRYLIKPKRTLQVFAALPLILGLMEAQLPNGDHVDFVESSTFVAASPAIVWNALSDASEVHPSEMAHDLPFRIGVPRPLSGHIVETASGRVRKSVWEKGVHFDEVISDWQPDHYLRWTYSFAPDSFPANALDDHVRVGGEFFDLRDTSYLLEPEGDGTRLTMRVSFRVSTHFNWYSGALARLFLRDFVGNGLDFYRARGELAAAGSRLSHH